MKERFNGKVYDTDKMYAFYTTSNDTPRASSTLYMAADKRFFIYKEGDCFAMQLYAGNESWTGGEILEPADDDAVFEYISDRAGDLAPFYGIEINNGEDYDDAAVKLYRRTMELAKKPIEELFLMDEAKSLLAKIHYAVYEASGRKKYLWNVQVSASIELSEKEIAAYESEYFKIGAEYTLSREGSTLNIKYVS